jgi:hypothetical protein
MFPTFLFLIVPITAILALAWYDGFAWYETIIWLTIIATLVRSVGAWPWRW